MMGATRVTMQHRHPLLLRDLLAGRRD